MRGFLVTARAVLDKVSTAALWLAGIGLVTMTLIVGWQVFSRYWLNDSPNWSEPLSLQLMSWFILFGSAVGVRESVHLGLDLVRHNMPEPVRRGMDLINLALIAAFGMAMTYYGVLLAQGTWGSVVPVLGWPGGVDFFPLIGGGVLIALFAAERFLDVLIHVPTPADLNAGAACGTEEVA